MKRLFLLTLNFSLLTSLALAQSLPKPAGRITDLAGVIDPATEEALDRALDQLEQKTSSEIAVATVESLNGMSVEEYANRLFKEWGVGQAKEDNGVLVLVAPNDREMRIEVGYGLEGVLPDGLAGQVIRDDFTPRFREGDYSGGIRNGVLRLIGIVEKHQVLTPEEIAKLNSANSGTLPSWGMIPFFGLFVTLGFGIARRRPSNEDRSSPPLRKRFWRHANLHEHVVHGLGDAPHARAVGDRRVGARVSTGRPGVWRRVAQYG